MLLWPSASSSFPFCNENQRSERFRKRKQRKPTSCVYIFLTDFCVSIPGGSESSVSPSAKSLSLNLKNQLNQTLDQLITSTPAWPVQTSPFSPSQVDCAESYLNLLNLENGTKPDASLNGDLDPFIRANGMVDNKENSCSEIVPSQRNSASMDEK